MIGKPLRFGPERSAEEIAGQLESVTWSL